MFLPQPHPITPQSKAQPFIPLTILIRICFAVQKAYLTNQHFGHYYYYYLLHYLDNTI